MEKRGRVKVIDPVARTVVGTYLDIVSRVGTGGERGLHSIAFPPDFAESGHFYALYQTPPATRCRRASSRPIRPRTR